MTREELIDHLEHLAEYVKYSEDAPALREVIALLKTHEERTETHACDLPQSTIGQVNDTVQSTNDCISRKAAIDAVQHAFDKETILNSFVRKVAIDALKVMPSAQRDHIAEVSKKVDADLISRREAIDAFTDAVNDLWALDAEDINTVFQRLPPAQPEIIHCRECRNWISHC